jgi:hypothetical protein
VLASLLSSFVLAVAAQGAGEAQNREADMFGDPSDAAPAPAEAPAEDAAPAANRDDDIFGGATTTTTTTTPSTLSPGLATANSAILQDAEDALAIGGQLFLRLNGTVRETQTLSEAALTAPSILDAFADVRPNDRVRAYAQVRFTFDYTVEDGETGAFGQELSNFDFQLAQAWTKFDLGRVAYVTAGRQRIRWGTGRFWNPTDFVNQEIRNSVDFFDQRVGVDLLKVHFPFEALGWNLYLISMFDGVDVLEDTGLAARAEFVLGDAELALSSSVKKDAPLRFGADASAGIWLFDVRGEAVVSRGLGRKLFKGDFDFGASPPLLPEEVDPDDDDWWFQGTVGAEASFKYTDTDSFAVGAEYFYNSAGYDDASLYPFLFLNNAYTPLYTGRHYAALYAFAQGPFDFDELSLTVSTLGNLSDLSFISRFDVSYQLLQYVTCNAFVAGHWGSVGEFKLGVDVDPVPGILPDGFVIENDLVDVGVALRANF